jgi:serine/threonine protein kinase/Flp pilus assembly protein TadD
MSVSSLCPDAHALERYCAGKLDPVETERIQTHVQSCPACAARIATDTESGGSVLDSSWLDPGDDTLPPAPPWVEPPPVPAFFAATKVTEQIAPVLPDAAPPTQIGRYPVLGLIGRGGMGAVYRALDTSLQRPLALKVLLPEHAHDDGLRQRFLNEARIMGRLQHPGIAPIHEIGVLPDGRPFFSMKQIQGQTFAALLHNRTHPSQDQPAMLGIFAQVCQTVGYAHSRGILHRDLKPDNVMVGAFGEVQVMDWGLAKELPRAWQDDAQDTQVRPATVLPETEGTVAGTVMGTLAYMAPEQARGEMPNVDERSDVFGLGAILCEILTGQPPYRAVRSTDRHAQAVRADLAEALERLAVSGADMELVDLARQCLAPQRELRPVHAGAVAVALSRHETGMRLRLREAELERRAAEVKAGEERKRRNVGVALLALALLFVAAAGAAAVWYFQDRADRAEQESREVAERNRLDQERSRLAAAQALEKVKQDERSHHINKEVAAALDDAAQAKKEIDDHLADAVLTSELLSDPASQWKGRLEFADMAWERASSVAGKGREGLSASLKIRLAKMAAALAVGHAHWKLAEELDQIRLQASLLVKGKLEDRSAAPRYQAFFNRLGLDVEHGDPEKAAVTVSSHRLRYVLLAALDHWAEISRLKPEVLPRILEVSRKADPDPWRVQARDPAVWHDVARLLRVAADVDPARHSPQVLILLAWQMTDQDGAEFLRRAGVAHPRDFWLHFHRGNRARDPAERAGCFQVAVALRPDSAVAHFNLGVVLHDLKDVKAAAAAYRKAIALEPQLAVAHNNLGNALLVLGDRKGAEAAYRKAIECDDTLGIAYGNLARIVSDRGDTAGALPLFRKAAECDPNSAVAQADLGGALFYTGDLHGSIDALRKAVKLDPSFGLAQFNLGVALTSRGDLEEAVEVYRKAADRDPKNARIRCNLALVLQGLSDTDRAVEAFRDALARDPQMADAHTGLGIALRSAHALKESVEVLEAAAKRLPKNFTIRKELRQSRRWLELDARLPDLLAGKIKPAAIEETLTFAELCKQRFHKQYAAAHRLYREAFGADPDLEPRHRFDAAVAALLLAAGQDATAKVTAEGAAELRRQAKIWLKAELEVLRIGVASPLPAVRYPALARLAFGKRVPELASIRDPAALKLLPAEERAGWERLWAEVDQLQGAKQ